MHGFLPFDSSHINTAWSSLLIEELLRNGIDYFCISPGSRSTPLTVAAARHPRARTLICHDERGAAFHALGYARATANPAALICTSGTAAAHYFPALIEASMDHLPMMVLSADRPPELWETGANQAIRQHHLFGDYVKWFFELPCPDEKVPPQMLLTTVDQALYQARLVPAGPVHLNCPFREPLVPTEGSLRADYFNHLTEWCKGYKPYTCYEPFLKTSTPTAIGEIVELLQTTANGIVVIGRLSTDAQRQAVLQLLQSLQWPAFVDITSGLRLGDRHSSIIHYFDLLLLSRTFRNRYRPQLVLRIGGEPVSKRLLELIDALQTSDHHVVIKEHSFRQDPAHNVTYRLETDIGQACIALVHRMDRQSSGTWLQEMRLQAARVNEVIANLMALHQPLSEISVARLISENVPANHGLWLASSMPIRDMQMYASHAGQNVQVAANRGASGIDGAIASATGFAVGLGKPVTMLLGDLSCLHDMNSLMLVQKSPQPLVIVVINNNGGGIFSFLPIARFKDVFEGYFGTPHDLRFHPLAELFAMAYAAPKTNGEFIEAYRKAVHVTRSTLIEVSTDRHDNFRLHQMLQRQIVDRLEHA